MELLQFTTLRWQRVHLTRFLSLIAQLPRKNNFQSLVTKADAL